MIITILACSLAFDAFTIFSPRRACTARVILLGLCVCLSLFCLLSRFLPPHATNLISNAECIGIAILFFLHMGSENAIGNRLNETHTNNVP